MITLEKRNLRLLAIGAAVTLLMFAFGFALVPMYKVLCLKLGINGKVSGEATPLMDSSQIDYSRTLSIQFTASTNANLPWDFHPQTVSVKLHPGENKLVYFYARNTSEKDMVVQAVPSVAPAEAAPYLKKTECFCFTQQYFKSGTGMLMPVLFHLDPNLPSYIQTITLSYTMFDAGHYLSKISKEKMGKL